MKSFVFCTCYINEELENLSVLRYNKWIDHYSLIADKLGADYLFLIDDGSTSLNFNKDLSIMGHNLPPQLSSRVNVVHFEGNLGRESINDYRGWWRSFTFSLEIALKYNFDKIIHAESDFFVLSERLTDFVKHLESGWAALYSRYYNFPESAMQVICKDAFNSFDAIHQQAKLSGYRFSNTAELVLPFTTVSKEHIGDRFGEPAILQFWSNIMKPDEEIDYIGQVPVNIRVPNGREVRDLVFNIKKMLNGDPTAVPDFLEQNNFYIQGL